MSDYRDILFKNYRRSHMDYLEAEAAVKLHTFRPYIEAYYLPHLSHLDRATARILEVGCSKGYALAVLHQHGFQQMYGVDLSPDDVAEAQQVIPEAEVVCEDAFTYLQRHPESFDFILMKATLEHVKKDQVIPLLQRINAALRIDGRIMIDVPNMDWFFASHERYMDFTHEVGFTQESLRQVLKNVFVDVAVFPADSIYYRSRLLKLRRKLAQKIIQTLFHWADAQGAASPIWSRNLVAVARKNQSA